jgi:hypothetical protein
MFNVDKFIEFLEKIQQENCKHIDAGLDGDSQCEFENDTLDTVISFLKLERFYDGRKN